LPFPQFPEKEKPDQGIIYFFASQKPSIYSTMDILNCKLMLKIFNNHFWKRSLLLLSVCLVFAACTGKRQYTVISPDGKLECRIDPGGEADSASIFTYSVRCGSRMVVVPSPFTLAMEGVTSFPGLKVRKTERIKVDQVWENQWGERREIPDRFAQLKLELADDTTRLNVYCRVYNEGVAFSYELISAGQCDSVVITDERFTFRFPADHMCHAAYRAQAAYEAVPVSRIGDGCERPLVVECDSDMVVALAEARLVDFARTKFGRDSLASYGVVTQLHGKVKAGLPLQSPWRVIMVAENPARLLEQNYLLLNLNPPSEIGDPSWIKPGKALRDVTLTTHGGKACIDFVAGNGMQYVEFDAGWYGPEYEEASDATTATLDPNRSKGPFDLPELIRYGKEKGVGVILYVNRRALERQLDTILPLYRDWGVAGIKFGFVRVGDQKWTTWMHDAVKKCAEYGMVVDIHDEYRPTGFSRTWPNLLTQEGIRGDEESPPNSHTLVTMFTRMLAGAADNTVCYYAERVTSKMGSHASQLAKSVCLFSPLQFLYWYDTPPQAPEKEDGLWGGTQVIGNEPELEFLVNVPTVWDETKVLVAEIGAFGVIARRNGDQWFLGGINGNAPVHYTLNFDFLEPGIQYSARIYSDDPSMETRTKVSVDEIEVSSQTRYPVHLESGNGFAVHLVPEK
jgi:alpha-glucosidase